MNVNHKLSFEYMHLPVKVFCLSYFRIALVVFLCVAFEPNLLARPKVVRNYAHRYITTRDGLIQMQLMCAYQDGDGFMWFGTKAGVSRWDGSSFRNYNTESGLPLGEIHHITSCGKYKLFFTRRRLMVLHQNDSIEVFGLPERMLYPGAKPMTIALDEHRILIMGLAEEYKESVDFDRFNFIFNINTREFRPFQEFRHNVIRVCGNRIITTKGIYVHDKKSIVKRLLFPYDVSEAMLNSDLTKCALQHFTEPQFELFDINRNTFVSQNVIVKELVHRGAWLPDGSFLILKNNSHEFFPPREAGLMNKLTYPNFAFVDNEKNLWVGTDNGLYNYFNLNIEEINLGIGAPDNIWSITEDSTGKIWFGSYGNGLYVFDPLKSSIKEMDFSAKLHGVTEAANKLIYMGSTTDTKKAVYIPTCCGLIKFSDDVFAGISSTSGCLYAYYDQLTEQIYYSGVNRDSKKRGLFVGMNSDRKFYPFERGFPLCIIRDGKGSIRIGSARGTATLLSNKLVDDTTRNNYSGVMSMVLDNQKRLWKATERGVFVELPNGSEYRVAEEYVTGTFTSMTLAQNRYIVAGGTQGFVIIDINSHDDFRQMAVVKVGYDGGFTGLESVQNSIWTDSKGIVWLGTALNVLKFDPDKVFRDNFHFTPVPRISEIAYSEDNTLWKRHFFNDGTIKLSNDNKFLRIDYVANSMTSPQSLRFRYRLSGLSDNWSKPVSVKSVYFTNLRFGKYRFELQSSLDGVVWSPIVQSPEFEITVPIYLRPVTLIFYFLLILLLSIFLTRFFTKKKQKRRIEAVRRRQLVNELQLNTLRSKIIPHFTNNVLSAIGHFAMTDKLKAGHYIAVFSKFTGLTLANADRNYISLTDELEYLEKYLELEKMRFDNRFDYCIQIDESTNMDLLLPTMTLHTYCDNAVRHGLVHKKGPGKLTVSIKSESDGVRMIIQDDGIGRQKAKETGTRGNGKGLKLIEAQLEFYNQNNTQKITQKITDLYDKAGNAAGTSVELFVPFGYRFEM